MAFPLTDDLRQQYQNLFNTCTVSAAHVSNVNQVMAQILPNQARYQSVADPLGIPWYFVALIHSMETSLNFNCHLHNGDPLTARTVHVPAGRPVTGDPKFTWEQSATDALRFKSLANLPDWSLPAILYRLEGYNGFGYRSVKPPINSPYLWSFSNHYTQGKFTSDHGFDPKAVSKQCGAAVILFQMVQSDVVSFASAASGGADGSSGDSGD
jgi:lysozyme family protein